MMEYVQNVGGPAAAYGRAKVSGEQLERCSGHSGHAHNCPVSAAVAEGPQAGSQEGPVEG